jgi:hypothetical protein
VAIARDATNTIGAKTGSATTSLSATWAAATTAGSTLLLAVAWNPNSTNGTSVTLPSSWSAATLAASATRTVAGADTMKVAVYTIQNAASQSGTITVTFSGSFWATLHLVPIMGAATVSVDVTASDNFSSLACDTGTTATTALAAEYLFGFMANANSASTQSAPTNTFALIDQQTSTGSGTDHLSAAIYDRTVAATGTYGTGATISGATSRSWAGVIVTLKQATAGGTLQGSFGTGTGGTTFRSWTGLSARTTSADVSATAATYGSTFNLRSCYKLWSAFEPSAPSDINTGTYNWTGLSNSIQAAADSQLTGTPWRLIFRIEMGYAAPAWLFTTGVQPVTEWFTVDAAHNTSVGASADNNHCPRVFDGSGNTDTNLIAHTTRMLRAINTYLQQSDGHGHLLGDWVYFMAIAMPTVQPGTEMTTEPGPSTPLAGGTSFVYDGPPAYRTGATTYRAINTNFWNAVGSTANRQTWFKNAWITAIDLHAANLTACPSAIALGDLFGDGWAGAQSIATTKGAQYGDNLVFMTTSLQTDTVPYPTGTYKGWSAAADQAMKNATAVGSPVGFQTAGATILSSEAKQKAAFDSGLGDYNMAFFETSPGQAANYFPASTTGTGWPGEAAAQALLVPTTGNTPGQITGQANVTMTPTVIAQANLYALDTFSRTSVNTWGSADQGGAYTLTGTAADFDVGSGTGTIIVSAANQTKEANLAGILMDDTDQRLLWSLGTTPAGGLMTVRTYARKVDANNLYMLGVFITTSNAFQVHAKKIIGGVTTAVGSTATVAGLSFSTGVNYWIRTSVTGSSPSTLTVKVWADGTAEPDWQFSAQDNDTILQATGSVSVIARAEASATSVPNTFTFDAYQVFPASPQLVTNGQAGMTAAPLGSTIPAGTGHRHTPRS